MQDYNSMKPLFERVLLKVENLEEKKDLFGIDQEKPKVFLVDAATDCKEIILNNIGAEVLFNGVIAEQIEETDEYKVVLTHQTNLLMI